jgi:RES domain-containing protein
MTVYRFSKEQFRLDLSGKGAELYGGRWNSKGVAMLYTSQSRALAFAEIAIHLPIGIVPDNYFLIAINIPDAISMEKLDAMDLPTDWRSNPHSNSTQQIGDKFLSEGNSLVLQVPSAIVPGDFNFLLNPSHRQMGKVEISNVEPFEFDSRFIADTK